MLFVLTCLKASLVPLNRCIIRSLSIASFLAVAAPVLSHELPRSHVATLIDDLFFAARGALLLEHQAVLQKEERRLSALGAELALPHSTALLPVLLRQHVRRAFGAINTLAVAAAEELAELLSCLERLPVRAGFLAVATAPVPDFVDDVHRDADDSLFGVAAVFLIILIANDWFAG